MGVPEIKGLTSLRLIGRGSFADVFEGIDATGHFVAVKVARHESTPRFAREASALRRVGGGAAPRLYGELVTEDGAPAFVMERIVGVPLSDCPVPDSVPASLAVVARIAAALEVVHERGIVHRDLKPANLMLRSDGRVAIIDFGLARFDDDDEQNESVTDAARTRAGTRVGTPLYMSPEQCRGLPTTHRADLYSLAVIAYELIAGRPPFAGSATAVHEGHLALRPPSMAVARGLPKAVDVVFLKALAKTADNRFETASSFLDALQRALVIGASSEVDGAHARDAARSVAVLAVEVVAEIAVVSSAVAARDGVLVDAIPRGYLAAFPLASTVTSGLAEARAVVEALRPVRSAMHVLQATVRHSASGVRMIGADLEDVSAWWSRDARGNPYLTPQALEQAGQPVSLRVDPETIALRGRERLLGDLLRDSDSRFASGKPVLTTLFGEAGSGKTRLLRAAAAGNDPIWVESREQLARALGVDLAAAIGGCTGAGAVRQSLARALAEGLLRLSRSAPVTVVLDDAHAADHVVLDALEQATSIDAGGAVWALVAALPRIAHARPGWGHRAAKASSHVIGPLDEQAFRAVVLDLVPPVEYVTVDVLAHLSEITGRVPAAIVDVAASLRESGAMQRLPGGEAAILRSEQLLHRSATPFDDRVALEAIRAMSEPLRALATLCAVVGDRIDAALIDAAALSGDFTSLDARVGMSRLERLGVLLPSEDEGVFHFASASLRRGLEAVAPEATRSEMHATLLELLDRPGADLFVVARHALRSGVRSHAGRLYLELAEERAREFRYDDAERYFATAVEQLQASDKAETIRALSGRGEMRQSLGRHVEALSDIDRALGLALEPGTGAESLVAELHLERAEILDWLSRFSDSAAAAADARAIVDSSACDDRLAARCAFAEGRSAARRNEFERALLLLSRAVKMAAVEGDRETEIEGLVTLSIARVFAGQLALAERTFEETIDLCNRSGDRFHLCVAYNNRILMWIQRGDLARARADALQSAQLALEVGNFLLERSAYGNLAELHLWLGDADAAQRLSNRAVELSARFGYVDPELWIFAARVCAAIGDAETAIARLAHVRLHCVDVDVSPSQQVLINAVEAAVEARPLGEWKSVLERSATESLLQERLEIEYLCALTLVRCGDLIGAAHVARRAASRADCPESWELRFRTLTSKQAGV